MTCLELFEFLSEYVDGRLSEAEAATFQRHLDQCPDCIAFLNTFRACPKLVKAAVSEESCPVPPDVVTAILAARSGQVS
ncbi:MAG: zf-HC2 domain-containing protein [Gemmataceae bacterium]|nr:zf-HC2 domain-containing protein [Gemmataceae bacterium]